MTYTVYFRYFSEYEDEAENSNEIVIHRYEADDLDELFEILEEDQRPLQTLCKATNSS